MDLFRTEVAIVATTHVYLGEHVLHDSLQIQSIDIVPNDGFAQAISFSRFALSELS